MDDKVVVVVFDNLFYYFLDMLNVRLGNIELINFVELWWGGINDVNELKVEFFL